MDLTGKNIDRYKVVSELGRGGMAVVYRAIDTMLDRNVAIKVILPEGGNTEKFVRRFKKEAKTLANLSHPNIVKVLDYGEFEGNPYLVMEYISSGALKATMGKPIPYAEAAATLVPIARALHYAHQQRIVHRDVKPENILINESGQPMLSDFGILKVVDVEESRGLTGTGRIVGTPAYMSPEQIRGREIDGRADVYSLGIVFFEMITGRKPYNAGTPIELSMQHLHDPIPKAKQFVRDLPAEVEQVIVKSMAKSPEDRYQSMLAFAQDLEKLSGASERITAERRAVKEEGTAGKRQKRSYLPAFIAASLLVVIGILTVLFGEDILSFVSQDEPPLAAATGTSAGVVIQTQPPTNTKPPPTRANTPRPSATPTVFVVKTFTPTGLPDTGIQPSNAGQVAEVRRVDRISVIRMDWVENGNWLINAGSNALSFINPNSAAVEHRINLPGDIPLSLGVASTDGKVYVLVNAGIRVVDMQTFKILDTFTVTGGANSLAASPDGKLLALGISDNKVQILNASDGSVRRSLRSNYGGWSVAFSPDSKLVVGGTSQGMLMWETDTGLWLPVLGGESTTIKSLVFSNDGTMLAGGGNGVIFIWDVAGGDLKFQSTGNFGDVNSLDFSPDNSMLVSGSEDGMVRLWNTASGALIRELTGHTSQIFGVCFSPDGKFIASGANEGSIRIWGLP
ncbi:MAG: serine/threonine protein kinase [Anaerolineales bacterium]|nr:serine/threonine protein kinase [Anaerolineales bacterium]NUQ83451.1 protein kinase [Anaerolineales bacterium]